MRDQYFLDIGVTITQLRTAQLSNRRIGVATGIVMGLLQVSDIVAYAAIRRVSMDTNRKVHDVAEDVILSGRLPPD